MSSFLDAPPATRVPPATLPGVATGAAAALTAMALYQLVRLGFWLAAASTVRSGASAPAGLPSAERFVGLELLPSLLSLGPSLLTGALLGGLVGTVVTLTWSRQSPLRAGLTGAVLAYAVALVVNGTLLFRHRTVPMTFDHWRLVLGYPSVIFVLVFAAVGAWLYVSRVRQVTAP